MLSNVTSENYLLTLEVESRRLFRSSQRARIREDLVIDYTVDGMLLARSRAAIPDYLRRKPKAEIIDLLAVGTHKIYR